ncbi:hypothetical protein AAGQ96_02645 [Pantoea sp. MBD-2R]
MEPEHKQRVYDIMARYARAARWLRVMTW